VIFHVSTHRSLKLVSLAEFPGLLNFPPSVRECPQIVQVVSKIVVSISGPSQHDREHLSRIWGHVSIFHSLLFCQEPLGGWVPLIPDPCQFLDGEWTGFPLALYTPKKAQHPNPMKFTAVTGSLRGDMFQCLIHCQRNTRWGFHKVSIDSYRDFLIGGSYTQMCVLWSVENNICMDHTVLCTNRRPLA